MILIRVQEVNSCVRLLSDCEEGLKNFEAFKRQNAINEENITKKGLDMQELINKEQVYSRENMIQPENTC
jgi:NADH:ubiquinone oxidoreductase subunit D